MPDQAKLEEVYRREWAMHEAQARLDDMLEGADLDPSTVPGSLAAKVRRRLSKKPDLRWDGVIRELVQKARQKPSRGAPRYPQAFPPATGQMWGSGGHA